MHCKAQVCLPCLLFCTSALPVTHLAFPHANSDSTSADTQPVLLSNKPWAQGLTYAFVGDMGTFLQCAHFYALYLCGQITQTSTIKIQLLYIVNSLPI